jgi:hypothetical protein
MCSTSSPTFLQVDHSSASVRRATPLGKDAWSMKCRDEAVATARTSAHSARPRQRVSNLIAATLPDAATRTRGLRLRSCLAASSGVPCVAIALVMAASPS